jgi:hypothetical protein
VTRGKRPNDSIGGETTKDGVSSFLTCGKFGSGAGVSKNKEGREANETVISSQKELMGVILHAHNMNVNFLENK